MSIQRMDQIFDRSDTGYQINPDIQSIPTFFNFLEISYVDNISNSYSACFLFLSWVILTKLYKYVYSTLIFFFISSYELHAKTSQGQKKVKLTTINSNKQEVYLLKNHFANVCCVKMQIYFFLFFFTIFVTLTLKILT